MIPSRVDAHSGSRRHAARIILLPVFAILAILIGLFITPSVAAATAESETTHAASAVHTNGTVALTSSPVSATTAVDLTASGAGEIAVPAATAAASHDHSGHDPLHCAIIGMACSLLFVLASLVILAVRLPSWLPRVGPVFFALPFFQVLLLEVHRPNLQLLSISRV